VPRARIVVPTPMRLEVHRAKLPDLSAVIDPRLKASRLFLLAYLKPILDKNDSRLDDGAFPARTEFKESGNVLLGAKPHHPFHSGAVVPTAVEYDHFAGCREVREIALHVHLGFLSLSRSRQCYNPEHSGADSFGDALNDAALP